MGRQKSTPEQRANWLENAMARTLQDLEAIERKRGYRSGWAIAVYWMREIHEARSLEDFKRIEAARPYPEGWAEAEWPRHEKMLAARARDAARAAQRRAAKRAEKAAAIALQQAEQRAHLSGHHRTS
jgi:hypothetical protein